MKKKKTTTIIIYNDKKKKNKNDETAGIVKDNEFESTLLSLKFSNLMVSLIDKIVAYYWSYSMDEYWSIFEQILMFDHEYRYYFVNIESSSFEKQIKKTYNGLLV